MRQSVSIKKINNLPQKPGVYFLKNKRGEIFYIGKANNIRARLQDHIRNGKILKTTNYKLKTNSIEWLQTANEIEALIKEAQYVKYYMPRLNVRLRDDKKYSYVGITQEKLPRIFITHQPSQPKTYNLQPITYTGPFTDAKALRLTLHFLRKTFPYYFTTDKKIRGESPHKKLPCSYCHLGLCPGSSPDKVMYKKNIRAIRSLLEGKKDAVLKNLKMDLREASKNKEYEKARQLHENITALEKIFTHYTGPAPTLETKDISHAAYSAGEYLAELLKTDLPIISIEGYDISNIQGREPTASMVRFNYGQPNKALYRKFNIKAPESPNDYLMMREVIRRRFAHSEWSYPDLILIDGGRGQLNAARLELRKLGLTINVVSLAKRFEELYIPSKQKPILINTMPQETGNLLKHIRNEAHRFAISHHRKRHRKVFMP